MIVWTLSGLGILICLLILAGMLAPWGLSTPWGRQFLVRQINQRIPGELQIEDLALGWISPNRVKGLSLLDANGELILHCDEAFIGLGLLELWQRQPLREARLSGGSLVLEMDQKGASSLERALGLTPSLPCRSPRAAIEEPCEIDHIECEWTVLPTGALPTSLTPDSPALFVSSALCRQGRLQGSWRLNLAVQRANPVRWDLEVDHLPTEILDTGAALVSPSLRGLPRLLLGDDLSLVSQGTGGEKLAGSLAIRSPHFSVEWAITGVPSDPRFNKISGGECRLPREALAQFLKNGGLRQIDPQTDLSLTIAEARWDSQQGPQLLIHQTVPSAYTVAEHQLRVSEATLALERVQEIWTLQALAEGQGDQLPWKMEGDLQLAPFKGALQAEGLPVWLFEPRGQRSLARRLIGGEQISFDWSVSPQRPHPWTLRASLQGQQPSALGLPLSVEAHGHLHDREVSFEVECSAPRLELRSAGSWIPGQTLDLKASSALLRWSAATVQGLGFRSMPGLGRQVVPLRLFMDPLSIDLCRGGWPTLRARLEGTSFELEQLKNPLQISQLEGKLAIYPSDERASVQLTADLHSMGQPKTSFALSGTAREIGQSPSFEGRLDCPSLPLSLVEAFYKPAEGISELLGPSLAIQADLQAERGGAVGRFDVALQAGGLQVALPLSWEQAVTLTPSRTASLYWKIQPAEAKSLGRWWSPLRALELMQPFTLGAELAELSWTPGKDPLPALSGVVRLSPIQLQRTQDATTFIVREGVLTLSQDEEQPLTHALLSCQVELEEGALSRADPQGGRLLARASWNRHAAWKTFTLDAEAQHLPIEGLSLIDPQGGAEASAVMGSEVSARLEITPGEEITKGWGLWLKSPYLKIAGTGWARKGGALGLQTPLLAAWTSHPLARHEDLGALTPLLTAILPNQTVALSVAPEAARFSWKSSSLEALSFAKATVDVGQIQLKTTELFSGLDRFLQQQEGPTTTLWLTPVYLSTEQDKLLLNRVDLLIDQTTPLALWGSIGLRDGALQMTAGFPEETLIAFLSSPVGSKGLFTVNVEGTLEDPRVDWKGAIARLAVASATKLNVGAMLFGSVLDRLFTKGVPEPTTQPFPWKSPGSTTPKEKILQQLEARLSSQLSQKSPPSP